MGETEKWKFPFSQLTPFPSAQRWVRFRPEARDSLLASHVGVGPQHLGRPHCIPRAGRWIKVETSSLKLVFIWKTDIADDGLPCAPQLWSMAIILKLQHVKKLYKLNDHIFFWKNKVMLQKEDLIEIEILYISN